MKSFVVVKAF